MSKPMYTLYYAKTPNGNKPHILLEILKERLQVSYELKFINISVGDQFTPEFLKISPNNKIPCLVDNQPSDGEAPISVFESGAILIYLAEKHQLKSMLPTNARERKDVLEWLFWQVSSQGPMLGQNHHFTRYAPIQIEYAKARYIGETERLYRVLEQRFRDKRSFVCGEEMTIADVAIYPWTAIAQWHQIDIQKYPFINEWNKRMAAIPAVNAAMKQKLPEDPRQPTEEDRIKLFGISRETLEKLDILPPKL